MRERYDPLKWAANGQRMPRRRKLAPLMALGILFAALPPFLEIFTANENPDGNVSTLFAMSLLLVLCVTQSPFARTTWMTTRGLSAFDEYERAALAEATTRAFRVVILMAMALFVWLWLASIFGWPAPVRPRQWHALGWSFLIIAATLPIFFAELMVPHPPEGDDAEDEA